MRVVYTGLVPYRPLGIAAFSSVEVTISALPYLAAIAGQLKTPGDFEAWLKASPKNYLVSLCDLLEIDSEDPIKTLLRRVNAKDKPPSKVVSPSVDGGALTEPVDPKWREARTMAEEGRTWIEIATAFAVTSATAKRWAKRAGFES